MKKHVPEIGLYLFIVGLLWYMSRSAREYSNVETTVLTRVDTALGALGVDLTKTKQEIGAKVAAAWYADHWYLVALFAVFMMFTAFRWAE